MKLEIGNDQGHVIIDDTSGKIMSVLVRNAVEGKSDFIGTTSYSNNKDGTHTDLRPEPKKPSIYIKTVQGAKATNRKFNLEFSR